MIGISVESLDSVATAVEVVRGSGCGPEQRVDCSSLRFCDFGDPGHLMRASFSGGLCTSIL